MLTADLTDEEIDRICDGPKQNAAKVRYLREVLMLPVQRKPNGRPLVRRADWERTQHQRPANGPNSSKAA
jgi:hypothetical protein